MQKLSQFTSHVTFILHHTSDKKPVSRDTVNYFAFSVQILLLFHFHFPDKTINHNAPHRALLFNFTFAQIRFVVLFHFHFYGKTTWITMRLNKLLLPLSLCLNSQILLSRNVRSCCNIILAIIGISLSLSIMICWNVTFTFKNRVLEFLRSLHFCLPVLLALQLSLSK